MRKALEATIVCGLLLLLGATLLRAQGARPESADIAALLAEVKGLRAEINDAASGSMRMQLLVARLSLQEQRIATVSRQLADAQRDYFEATQATSGLQSQLKGLDGVQGPGGEDLEAMRNGVRRELAVKQQRQEQLRLQVDDLQNAVTAEQGRWTDFNNRIDELERSLPPRR